MTEQYVARPPRLVALIFGRHADYVWELRYQFTICLILFVFSLVMGFYLGDMLPKTLLEELMGSFPNVENLSLPAIFLFILANNVIKSLVWMLLGIVFSAPPLLFTIINGFFVGYVAYSVSVERGLEFTVAALVPHGVVEIPTILLSMAAGMRLGYQLINSIRGRGSLSAELRSAMSLYVWRIVPLLVLAAFLEITLTPFVVYILGFGPSLTS